MNNVAVNTAAFANVVTPFSPVGKQAVGLENAEAKQEVFSPIEEPATKSAVFDKEEEAARSSDDKEKVKERAEQEQQRQQQEQIRELAARDREVRAHEQAHASVGGQYAGSASFTFERGPDGVNYAVGGEVPISLPSGGDDPQATLAAAEQVRRAALAPADPSPQDRSVAAEASQISAQAQSDIAELQAQERADRTAQSAEARKEEQLEQERQEQERREDAARQERLDELRSSARRSSQLGEQLVTLDNIGRSQNVGSVLDQLA